MSAKYKALALDIDGTLTSYDQRITPATHTALIRMQRQGVVLILASGRSTYGILQVARELKMEEYGGYVLSYNGGKITSCRDGSILARHTIDLNLIPRLYDIADRNSLAIFTYLSQEILTETPNHPLIIEDSRLNRGMPIKVTTDFVEGVTRPPFKVVMCGDTDGIARAQLMLEKELGGQVTLFTANKSLIEICPMNVDKGRSLGYLLPEIGLSMRELIAVGDTQNDIQMIQRAGLGVAMANATEAVKQCADYVTKSNQEDGIEHLLQKFIFNVEERPEADLFALNALSKNTLMESLGIVCTRLEEGYVEATMPVDVRTRQPMGILHGGASLALAETVAGYGSIYLLEENEIQVGVQVSGNHISSAHEGEILRAEGSIIHRGRSTHVWNVDVYTTSGKRVAAVRVLNSIIKRR